MFNYYYYLLFLFFIINISTALALDKIQHYYIQYSLDNGQTWNSRGLLDIKYNNSVKLAELDFFDENIENEVINHNINAINRLIQQNCLYMIKIGKIYEKKKNSEKKSQKNIPYVSSIPICSLQNSNFLEYFTFYIDVYGEILSINYETTYSSCYTSSLNEKKKIKKLYKKTDMIQYKPKGRILIGKSGEKTKDIIVDLSQNQQQNKNQKKKIIKDKDGNTKIIEEKTFFQKYWLYILIAVFFFLGSGTPPQAQANNSQQRQGGGTYSQRRR